MQNIIGSKVRAARIEKQLTQAELAALLQLEGYTHSRNTIAKIEAGIRQVTDIEVRALAKVLHISIARLFNEDTHS